MTFEDLEAQAQEIIARYEFPKAAMLPLLWRVQENQGYVSLESEGWDFCWICNRVLGVWDFLGPVQNL